MRLGQVRQHQANIMPLVPKEQFAIFCSLPGAPSYEGFTILCDSLSVLNLHCQTLALHGMLASASGVPVYDFIRHATEPQQG